MVDQYSISMVCNCFNVLFNNYLSPTNRLYCSTLSFLLSHYMTMLILYYLPLPYSTYMLFSPIIAPYAFGNHVFSQCIMRVRDIHPADS